MCDLLSKITKWLKANKFNKRFNYKILVFARRKKPFSEVILNEGSLKVVLFLQVIQYLRKQPNPISY